MGWVLFNKHRGRLVLSTLALVSVASEPALAVADGCAVVGRIADGYLNVREQPSASARIVRRIYPGEFIDIDSRSHQLDPDAKWTHVTGTFRVEDRKAIGEASFDGWVLHRFIVPIDCFEGAGADALPTAR